MTRHVMVCDGGVDSFQLSLFCHVLSQVLDANKCFEKQPHSALSLQLAAYYYSLQIYTRLTPCFRDKCHPLYRVSPLVSVLLMSRVKDFLK